MLRAAVAKGILEDSGSDGGGGRPRGLLSDGWRSSSLRSPHSSDRGLGWFIFCQLDFGRNTHKKTGKKKLLVLELRDVSLQTGDV